MASRVFREEVLNICIQAQQHWSPQSPHLFRLTITMPESMFGRPLQHLLPSQPQPSPGVGSGASEPLKAPLPFKDFHFSSIGKQPELLSRISLPQPDNIDYHSPSPSPTSTPPPAFTNDPHPSRPTLFQQLAGSLASRIQMNDTPSNDIANSAHGASSRFPIPPLRISTVGRATKDASLIPPVEVLPQPPDSSPPISASWALNPDPLDAHSSAACTPLMNTTTIMTSRLPTPPTVATDTAPTGPMEPFSSMAVVDTIMRGLQPSPSAAADIDSLTARQERLQSINAKLANLAAPLLPTQSPPPDHFSQPSTNITTDQPSEPRHSSTPVALHHPYSANQTSDRAGSSAHENRVLANDSSLSLLLSPTTLTREFQSHDKAITAALQNMQTVLNAAHRAQVDNENAFALRIRTFGEQRAAFEQRRRTQEATLQQELRELQRKCEELNAKEAELASLEKEYKAREETRKAVLAKRQAQEDEKRAAETKRVQEVREQLSNAFNELKEIEVLKEKCQIAQLPRETIQDDLPTAPLEGMNEKEIATIKSRNDLLLAIKHLRRMHTDKVQKLEEITRTLSMLGIERKEREAEEAERRQAVEEERLRAHAKKEQARQMLDEKRRQLEADKKRQEAKNGRAQAQLLVEQQAHAEAQAHGLGRVEVASDQMLKHLSHSEGVSPSQPPRVADVAKIRAAREENLSEGTTNVMDVDDDGGTSALHHTVPSSDIHTSPATSPSKQKKKDKPISGGVMLATSTSKASGGRLPPKPSAPAPPSPDHVAENTQHPASTSPAIPAHAEGSHGSSFPVQLASVFNRTSSADIRSTPDYKHAFSRAPKSQTILDATNGGQELNIGPVAGVSPTQQNVNLRHLKRFRGRAEGNDSGDRSVRTIQVKSEEDSSLIPKEEQDVRSCEVQASLLMNPPAALPPRPAVIPPPRLRMFKKRHEAPASQPDPSSSYPSETNELSSARREVEADTDEQPREALPRDIPSSQAMNVPVQLPSSSESTNSLLLGPVYAEPQPLESRINTSERPAQDRSNNYDTTPSEPASATSSQMGEDPPRSNRRFTDEDRRAHKANGSRCVSDHYSPPSSRSTVPSPAQAYRRTDARLPQNSSNGPRAEPMRAPSPTVGRKRPPEFNDNEHGHRARRQRGDVWVAPDNDRHRVDSYRPQWDRRLGSEPDERHAAYRSPTSPIDRIPSYPSDVPRVPYDNRTYAPEEPAVPAARWEPPHRRPENDDTYQRYLPPPPAYSSIEDQHDTDDIRMGHYEPMMEERRDSQSDPSLLARIHDTQRFPVSVV